MTDFSLRQQRLQEKLKSLRIDGFLVTQNVDIYYFTGSMQAGFLFIPAEGEAVFYVRRSVQRAIEESAVKVEPLGSMRSFGERLKQQFPPVFVQGNRPVLAAEFDVLPVQLFQKLEQLIADAQWVDGSLAVRETRMLKSADEISKLQAAAYITDLALEEAMAYVRIGMQELELMSRIEYSLRLKGHLGIMRMRSYNQEIITGMVGSGAAAAMPTYFDGPAGGQGLSAASPQSAGRKRIERNEPILIDIGCCIDGYVTDQTRTLVIGELDELLYRAYEVAAQILQATEANLEPGTICEDLYLQALELAEKAGLSDHFMGYEDDQVKFLGHGIGLEIDELPVLARGFKYPLAAGMVIAIEPKFTFPGRGVVGIENTYLITEAGYEKLTRSREGLLVIQE